MGCKAIFLTLLITVVGMVPLAAQQPQIAHARMDTRSVASGFARAMQELAEGEASSAWIVYSVLAVPRPPKQRSVEENWRTDCNCRCVLGRGCEGSMWNDDVDGRASMLVLVHVDGRHVVQIEPISRQCTVDANGAILHWLTDVNPAESVSWLSPYVLHAGGEESDRKVWQGALVAIVQTADPSVDPAMDKFLQPSTPLEVRKDATFWLGEARGEHGYQILRRIVQDDPSGAVRHQAVFGLSISKVPEAEQALIDVARHHPEASLRGEALFWLAQKAGKMAVGEIQDAIQSDPDTEVKRKAVFALTQLPPDQGVPMLIHVAQNNRNPEVRKQAFFWLGQSKDPRALDFIESVLTN
jgi:HEAT repeat protein